jgi:hypothetical protein
VLVRVEHFVVPYFGRLPPLPASIRPGYAETLVRKKHSSLFYPDVIDDRKKFSNINTGLGAIKLFTFVIYNCQL